MHYLRTVAETVLPRVMPYKASSTLLAVGDRYAQYRRYRNSRAPEATSRIESSLGLTVQGGPFRGMRYPRPNAYSRHAIPRLLGCYEQELHPALLGVLADPSYSQFLDIGSADGYYSVGFAFAARRPVYAFEIDPFERRYMRLMSRLNGVEELVRPGGWCSAQNLKDICAERSFIFCDCEGYEYELFQASLISSLSHCDLIIELHAAPHAAAGSSLLDRFSATHQVECISSRPRHAVNHPELACLGLLDDSFVSEFRQPGQQWAILTAKVH